MNEDDLVAVMVPKVHLAKVYGFIAKLAEEDGSQAGEAGGLTGDIADEWTPSRIRTAVQQSPPAMKDILRALAERADSWVPTSELAKAITSKPGADSKTIAGTLGAFTRRVGNRYAIEHWPFESVWDHAEKCRKYRMSSAMARQMETALKNGDHSS